MSFFHVRYSIEFVNEQDRNNKIFDDFRRIMINNHHAQYTIDATFYIYYPGHVDDLIKNIIELEFQSVISINNLNIYKVHILYDICQLSDPIIRKNNIGMIWD